MVRCIHKTEDKIYCTLSKPDSVPIGRKGHSHCNYTGENNYDCPRLITYLNKIPQGLLKKLQGKK